MDSLIGTPGDAYGLFPFAPRRVNDQFLPPGNATRVPSKALSPQPAQTGNPFW